MSLAVRVSGRNRARKWRLFLREFPPTPQAAVLDVGYAGQDYSPVENYIEKHYPYPHRLTALGVDDPAAFQRLHPQVRAVRYDGGRFPFDDGQFDVCWSNAVLEHVGGQERQVAFLREIARVARRAFITTPNRWFPIEVHTHVPLLHYLPKRLFDRLLVGLGKGWAAGDYMHLLDGGGLRRLLDRAGVGRYRIVRNRLWGWTLDFAVLFERD
ncbi:MAG: class I SAM-dependent methyltransferase [Planctomycetes bacterium]|nr:class I SAM-dependent methyltransferase [Planctomycetota bacterium]